MPNKSTKKAVHDSVIQTKRLILRQWYEKDLEPFAQLNADTRVREYFSGLLSREESDASVEFVC